MLNSVAFPATLIPESSYVVSPFAGADAVEGGRKGESFNGVWAKASAAPEIVNENVAITLKLRMSECIGGPLRDCSSKSDDVPRRRIEQIKKPDPVLLPDSMTMQT